MTYLEACCLHHPTEIEGETVCRDCGIVLGYSMVQSVDDWKSHTVGFFGKSGIIGIILHVAKNLNLPTYATQTIIQTTTRLMKKKITKKQAILFATVYACRIHKIPRLLEDVFLTVEGKMSKRNTHTEKSLLKMLNRITKKADDPELWLESPNKEYYLHAYLAKIQNIVLRETDPRYFEQIKWRAMKSIVTAGTDPSLAAKKAIMQNTCSVIRAKIGGILE